MPRSGTSLVEQIIGCHSQVFAAGELSYAKNLGRDLASGEKESSEKALIDLGRITFSICAISRRFPDSYGQDAP